jgi:hypothetical protein
MLAGGQHTYLTPAWERVSDLFDQYSFPVFNFADGGQFGTDGDFFDGWHGSERINLQLYITMAQALPEVFGQYSDIAALQQAISQASDTFNLFGNQF